MQSRPPQIDFSAFSQFCAGTPDARVESIREQRDTNRKDRVWI